MKASAAVQRIKYPKRKIKPEIQALIKDAHEILFDSFPCDVLSKASKIPYATVCCHKSRLKSSPDAATRYCKIREVKAAGFTREMLRPDISDWGDAE